MSERQIERRSAARTELRTEVDLESASNFFTGFSSNLGDGGLFVATSTLLPIGSPVDVRFSLPDGSELFARGVVRWLREVDGPAPGAETGMGIQFVELAPEVEQAIHTFMRQREPLFFPD